MLFETPLDIHESLPSFHEFPMIPHIDTCPLWGQPIPLYGGAECLHRGVWGADRYKSAPMERGVGCEYLVNSHGRGYGGAECPHRGVWVARLWRAVSPLRIY
jgi:hypothetical protein